MNPLARSVLAALAIAALVAVYESQPWGGFAVVIAVLGMLVAAEGRPAI